MVGVVMIVLSGTGEDMGGDGDGGEVMAATCEPDHFILFKTDQMVCCAFRRQCLCPVPAVSASVCMYCVRMHRGGWGGTHVMHDRSHKI